MSERPTFIDLKTTSGGDPGSRSPLPSPRVQYSDGEIPPLLSPLDAFAAQSRMMSKQLDLEHERENRMSRLDPNLVTRSLSQHRANRPNMFRSLSGESSTNHIEKPEQQGNTLTVEHPQQRPCSQHPRISGLASVLPEEKGLATATQPPGHGSGVRLQNSQPTPQADYFTLSRSSSPLPTPTLPNPTPTQNSPRPAYNFSPHKNSAALHLGLPVTTTSSIRAVSHNESSDDDYTSSCAESSFSRSRKLSASSGVSAPHSPMSPFLPVRTTRSPSLASETSGNAGLAARPHLNFSRPWCAPSPSALGRMDSSSSNQLNGVPHHVDLEHPSASTCVSPQSGAPELANGESKPLEDGGSYTYTKYALPRGREISRDSKVFSGLLTPHFEWQEPLFAETPSPPLSATPTGQETRPTHSMVPIETKRVESIDSRNRAYAENRNSSASVSDPKSADVLKTRSEDAESLSTASASTVRPVSGKITNGTSPGHHYLSAEDHVRKAIACHENGSLNESTYHLRIAAMQNHPTAMLLYALACRHGWGMRKNPHEGVQWLRKALDSASPSLLDDRTTNLTAPSVGEKQEKQTRQAQFALSLYELGVSHLNGWGIEQDKPLALRCFEQAGNWGDVDALMEAGFCYTEGVGCKKNLKKAAQLYRMADSKGANMVGNSW